MGGLGGKLLIGVVAVIALALAVRGCPEEEPAGSDSTGPVQLDQARESDAGRQPLVAQYDEQSHCLPLSPEGATCEVTPECSGWIREAPGLPAGLTHDFMPRFGTPEGDRIFKTVYYLKDGQRHVLQDGEHPSGVAAWDVCPEETITISYHAR